MSTNGKYKLSLPQGLTVRVETKVDATKHVAAGGGSTNHVAAKGSTTNPIASFKPAPAEQQVKIEEDDSALSHSIEESGEHKNGGYSQLVNAKN